MAIRGVWIPAPGMVVQEGEILAPMALPVLGGLLISDEVVDIFLPVRFYWVRRTRWLKLQKDRQAGNQEAVEQDLAKLKQDREQLQKDRMKLREDREKLRVDRRALHEKRTPSTKPAPKPQF